MGEPMTKERLGKYLGLKTKIECYEERIARMESEAEFPTRRESDGSMHMPGTGDRLERAIIRIDEYRERMAPVIKIARAEVSAIERAVNSLDDDLESTVLRLRYLEGEKSRLMKWKDVAMLIYHDDDFSDQRAAQRLHDKAIESIGKIEV